MGFSEDIKLQVKRLCAFQCCRCKEIGVEVHHICPESEGGPNDIDNAAPLCPTCHSNIGGNPDKRKEIRQMRDYWYEVVKEKYAITPQLEKLNEALIVLSKNQTSTEAEVSELKRLISEFQKQNEIKKTDNAQVIQRKASEFISATTLGNNVHANFNCRKCGTRVGLLIGTDSCPTCREPIT